MQTQQELARSYRTKHTISIVALVVTVGLLLLEIVDVFYQLDTIAVSGAIHALRIILMAVLVFWAVLVYIYGLRIERTTLNRKKRRPQLPVWIHFINRVPWVLRPWSFENKDWRGIAFNFIFTFVGFTLFQFIFPLTSSLEWGETLRFSLIFALLASFSGWVGNRQKTKNAES